MNDWRVVILHTHRKTLLTRIIETAFPGRVVSICIPVLKNAWYCDKKYLLDYFQRYVYDPEIWRGRVLTIYGTGHHHHFTYALTKLALRRRGLGEFNWTYFHWDNHRDDWGHRDRNGQPLQLDCANFVDSIAHDHQGIPFLIGPDCEPLKDSRGYQVEGIHIPIYHNFLTKRLQRSKQWTNNRLIPGNTGLEFPSVNDLRATPTRSYLSFDLDLLARSEVVSHFDQNDSMTLRRVCRMLDHVRPFKKIFGADILGYPDAYFHHPLSVLTIIILARKIMGLGIKHLLDYHTYAKRIQAASLNINYNFWEEMERQQRESPIVEEELMEILK